MFRVTRYTLHDYNIRMSKNPIIEVLLWPVKLVVFFLKTVLFAAFIIGGWFIFQMIGILPVQVPVSGASMLPTLPEEGFVDFQRYVSDLRVQTILPQRIEKGDIVVFENEKTAKELQKQDKNESGFVKRVIGLSGDTVSIKNGFVYVNGQTINEPYILQPRSTFGSDAIKDCQEIKVPDGKLLVLGDNRKISMDSRQIGLISYNDIEYYIPFEKQQKRFTDKWRDATHDLDTEFESLFDASEYVSLLNKERKKNNLDPLSYESKLEQSARLRAEAMLKYDDFSFEAEKSGYNMEHAMNDVGYSNIVFGEFPMTGYYTAEELFKAFLERAGARDFLLKPDYDDIGVSTFVGSLNGCPVQVVVQHLAGYVPPNYGSGEIASWKEGLERLKNIQPGWQRIKDVDEFYNKYKTEVDRMNEIIATRISHMEQIVKRMQANEWFTSEEDQWVNQDKDLSKEQDDLADLLNDAIGKF